jgi:hypothetical protein
MSAVVAEWKRPAAVDPVTIRCPACGTVFTRVLGRLHPPKGDPFVELECVCKDRRCRKAFTVKVGLVPC